MELKLSKILCILFTCLLLQSRSYGLQNKSEQSINSSLHCKVNIGQIASPDIPFPKGLAIAVWVIIAIVSMLSNILIINAVRANPHMRSTTNYLIVNMAVGDLLETVQSTIIVVTFIQEGVQAIANGDSLFDRVLCSLQGALFFTFMCCSIFSLLVITFDRFLAVTQPIRYKSQSPWTKYAIPSIWLVALAIPCHYAVINVKICSVNGKAYCIPKQSPFDAILIVTLGFAIPHAIMVVLYMVIAYKLWTRRIPGEGAQTSQSASQQVARKVTRLTVSILVAFDVSWTPVFLGCVFPLLYQGYSNDDSTFYLLSKLLMISNGTINATLYAVFNENFRNAFKNTLFKSTVSLALRNLKCKPTSTRSVGMSASDNSLPGVTQ